MNRHTLLAVLGVLFLLLTNRGCSSGGEVILYGKIFDAKTNIALTLSDNEIVTVHYGKASVETNESGFFSLKVPAKRFDLLRATANGYAPGSKPIRTPETGSMYVELPLLPWSGTKTFNSDSVGTLTTTDVTVEFPANSLNATGSLTAYVAYLNPSTEQERSAFPGGFLTTNGQLLESFGAIALEVRDADNNIVNLKNQQSATVELSVVNTTESSIPLWYYDEKKGRWEQEGSLSNCTAGTCQGTIPHLSWWNADVIIETSCILFSSKNSSGEPAVGVSVEARGIDYNGVSYATTDKDGNACLDVRKDSRVDIVGLTSAGLIRASNIQTPSNVASCAQNKDACTQLDESMIIENPKFQAILTWDQTPRDLDSHFTGPDPESSERFHVYFANKGSLASSPYAWLDTDDTDGFGPEITTLSQCSQGTYRYSVHNFSMDSKIETSKANVLVLLPNGSIQNHSIPTQNPNESLYWSVGDLTCDALCSCNWSFVNTFGDVSIIHP